MLKGWQCQTKPLQAGLEQRFGITFEGDFTHQSLFTMDTYLVKQL